MVNITTAALDAVANAQPRGEPMNAPTSQTALKNNRDHFIWPSNLAAPLPVFDSRNSASRPPAA
jgi:hypothetical protein